MTQQNFQQSEELFHLSPAQKRLWYRQAPGSVEAVVYGINLTGNLDTARFERALEKVIARHEILRTRFVERQGFKTPFQAIHGEVGNSWRWVETSNGDGAKAPKAFSVVLEAAAEELSNRPWVELSLTETQPEEYLLNLCLPALYADARGLANFFEELARFYGEEEPALPEAAQYVDYSEWRNQILEASEEAAETARTHWQERGISGLYETALPFENKGEEGSPPQISTRELDPELVVRCSHLAEDLGCSHRELLLGFWTTLLAHRLGFPESLVLAIGQEGRKHEGLSQALGLFESYPPVALHGGPKTRFRELVGEVRGVEEETGRFLDFFSWRLFGEEIYHSRDSLAFGFQHEVWPDPREVSGLRFAVAWRRGLTERFKLLLSCTEREEGIDLRLVYDPERYTEGDVERLLDEFEWVCRRAVEDPDRRLGELSLLDGEARAQVVEQAFGEATDFGAPRPFHRLFEEQIEEHGDRIAVVCENQWLSHGALEARANALACYLEGCGVGPDVLVALCLERSPEFVLAMLAVAKTGGAFVPVDPSQPPRRLASMLSGVHSPVVLTQEHLVQGLPEGVRRICLDADWPEIAAVGESRPQVDVAPENLAYIMFTSGSTGRPKGVMVEHGQLFNYLKGAITRLDLPAGGRYATVSTFAADLGNTMIFPALTTGGTLVIISRERAGNAQALRNYFVRHPVDCLKIVPSHLQALLEAVEDGGLLPRHRLVVGGEAARQKWMGKVVGLAEDCQVFNHYGPSETTVGVLTHSITPESFDPRCETLPLGKPIPNTRVYLCDPLGALVPPWYPGEVLIGGANLTRGYLGDPAQTAERFVPDPFSEVPGGRLYRTGDLARYLDRGVIEFLGRRDHQVKFHGFRIEVQEIEEALKRHGEIRNSVVQLKKDDRGHDVLVAYYVSRRELEVAELRRCLAESLQEETFPNLFAHLRRIPLNLNGKINLKGLPSVAEIRERLEKKYVMPRDEVEQGLATIWAEVLGVERVGVHDNFFELGGDSIQSIQIIARAQKLGFRFTTIQLFQNQTIAQLGELVRQARQRKEAAAPSRPALSGVSEQEMEQVAGLLLEIQD